VLKLNMVVCGEDGVLIRSLGLRSWGVEIHWEEVGGIL
jgi:hypothetical protein